MDGNKGTGIGSRKLVLASIVPVLLTGFYVFAETHDFPKMTVVGHRQEDGKAIVCTTGACFDSAQEESARVYMEWMQMYDSIPQDDLPMDGERFCSSLASKQPQGCSLSSPPASPGISVPGGAAWQPNGCGTGGVGTWFQDFILEVISSNSYSGDIHAPYPGVSFRTACDAHDRCWAAGGARATCDDAFRVSTLGACNAVSDPGGKNTCNGFAGLYHGAVATTDGADSAYAGSVAERTCALWALEMRENDCDD